MYILEFIYKSFNRLFLKDVFEQELVDLSDN